MDPWGTMIDRFEEHAAHWLLCFVLVTAFLLAYSTFGHAQQFTTNSYVPVGYQQITLSGATSLTVPAGARFARIAVATAGVRYRDDGVDPTSSVGMPIAVGGVVDYSGTLSAVRLIPQTGSPVVDVLYYR